MSPSASQLDGSDNESLISVITESEIENIVDRKVKSMVVSLQENVKSLTVTVNNQKQQITDLCEETSTLRGKNALLEGRVSRSEKEIDALKEEILYMQARSMRDNLVFYNVPEQEAEKTFDDTKAILTSFIKDEMKVSAENLQKVNLGRTHRAAQKGSFQEA